MRLQMLVDSQTIRVVKGAVREHIKRHGPVTTESAATLAKEILASVSGTMLQMAQETPVDHAWLRELQDLREKWKKNKQTIGYWVQRARNAEAELTKHNLPVPEPPKAKPPEVKQGLGATT